MTITKEELAQMVAQCEAETRPIKAFMDNLAYNSAKNTLLLEDSGPRIDPLVLDALNLPPAGMWTPAEVDETMQGVAAAASELAVPGSDFEAFCKAEYEDHGVMGDMEHIRALIVGDIPKAAFATDSELEVLYDQWQAEEDEKQKAEERTVTIWGEV